jgi:hypothetical protein
MLDIMAMIGIAFGSEQMTSVLQGSSTDRLPNSSNAGDPTSTIMPRVVLEV